MERAAAVIILALALAAWAPAAENHGQPTLAKAGPVVTVSIPVDCTQALEAARAAVQAAPAEERPKVAAAQRTAVSRAALLAAARALTLAAEALAATDAQLDARCVEIDAAAAKAKAEAQLTRALRPVTVNLDQ